ncbi:alginate lyase family protein [Chitinophaga sp.]|uniref:alginate lyase family protein n=1 Tax=Chitinophaga sp. TaxID=1869181 RepID=UPI002F93992C
MKKIFSFLLCCLLANAGNAQTTPFVHPGMDQSGNDLAYMKQQVLAGAEPWKSAFERLKAATDTSYNVEAYTHVLRGPSGNPNIGGNELSKGAGLAYNCALLWYITNDKAYANKAIAIMNAWSGRLWDFDYNDAKLLAAWTGHVFCNAAEIIRHTNAGWQQKEVDQFTHMLMTVYYPLIRYYYPNANGNWDAAIIHTIIAIAVFTDNHAMFDNAVDHFLHAPVNGSVFKYIYPSGQSQESMRDQNHVQAGIGEFAGAAQIAYTQGTDLFAIADNRIALGYEYTAGFLLGDSTYCYGPISYRVNALRDDYEYVYRHYAAQGIYLPKTKKAADSIRPRAARSILTALRTPASYRKVKGGGTPVASTIGYIAGAGAPCDVKIPANAVYVSPGQSLQDALNKTAGTNTWVVAKKGIHTLTATLKIPSGVTLCGEGVGTVLFVDPASGIRDAVINATDDMHDVIIRDLVLEGSITTDTVKDPNGNRSFKALAKRGGFIFRAQHTGQMKRLQFIHLTVQGCTFNGVEISGADGITIERCNFNENGSSIIPGPRLQHNLLLKHCTDIRIRNSRLDTSPFGSGIALDQCRAVEINSCEVARNAWYGISVAGCEKVAIKENLIEANDRGGLLLEYFYTGNKYIDVRKNLIQYNAGYGITAYGVENGTMQLNRYAGNGSNKAQELISPEQKVMME